MKISLETCSALYCGKVMGHGVTFVILQQGSTLFISKYTQGSPFI